MVGLFVTGEYLNIGFYAGCPIHSNGVPIGTLCAIDTQPRYMTEEQLMLLRDLASMVETELKPFQKQNYDPLLSGAIALRPRPGRMACHSRC